MQLNFNYGHTVDCLTQSVSEFGLETRLKRPFENIQWMHTTITTNAYYHHHMADTIKYNYRNIFLRNVFRIIRYD